MADTKLLDLNGGVVLPTPALTDSFYTEQGGAAYFTTLTKIFAGAGITASSTQVFATTGGAWWNQEVTSATNPNMGPDAADDDTGIGQNADDELSLIVGGFEAARAVEDGATAQLLLDYGTSSLPSLSFIGDNTVGMYRSAVNTVAINASTIVMQPSGSQRVGITTSKLALSTAVDFECNFGPTVLNLTPTSTIPVFCPTLNDKDTGVGWVSADILSFVAGGKSVARGFEGTTSGFSILAEDAVPADADLVASTLVFYWDETAAEIKVKAKEADGSTIKIGTVASMA